MDDLKHAFRRLDGLAAPDLSERIRTAMPGPGGDVPTKDRTRARIAAISVGLSLSVATALIVWSTFGSTPVKKRPRGPGTPAQVLPTGWSRLPDPPGEATGRSFVWTDGQLLAIGGYASRTDSYLDSVYAWSADRNVWTPLPDVPEAASGWHSVWTGSDVVILGGGTDRDAQLGPYVFNVDTASWRAIATPPVDIDQSTTVTWTGSEVVVWGGSFARDASNTAGAAYDPALDSWSILPASPLGMNLADGVWTGSDVVFVGSLLDRANRAETRTAVAEAYDPEGRSWTELPTTDLSPQATAAAWAGDRVVALDYLWNSASWTPGTDRWRAMDGLPFRSGECYPDAVPIGSETVLAFGCGEIALSEADGGWTRLHGGLTTETVEAHGSRYQLWRFATLIPAGDVVFFDAEGITVDPDGVPCYGCPDSPTSLWAFRLR